MATVGKKQADAIIEGNGIYPGDSERVVKIVQYNNAFNGGLAYGLIYQGMPLDTYKASPFILNPKTIFEYKEEK